MRRHETLKAWQRCGAFTMNELLVTLAVIGIVGLLLMKSTQRGSRVSATRIHCVNNLKNVGLAFRILAIDHGDNFLMQVSTNEGGVKELLDSGNQVARIFQCLSNELGVAKVMKCPADSRVAATNFSTLHRTNISYFVGLDARADQPQTMLAGDRNIRANFAPDKNGVLTLRTNDFIGWTAEMHYNGTYTVSRFFGLVSFDRTTAIQRGNVALSDGSVQQVDDARLRDQLRFAGIETNRFALPD